MDLDNGVQKLFFIKWMITEKPTNCGKYFFKKRCQNNVLCCIKKEWLFQSHEILALF